MQSAVVKWMQLTVQDIKEKTAQKDRMGKVTTRLHWPLLDHQPHTTITKALLTSAGPPTTHDHNQSDADTTHDYYQIADHRTNTQKSH
jgi:hypothetical protein